MDIYQGERDLQDKNQALAIPGGFQVDKEIAMSSEQLSQVRNSFNTTLAYIIINLQFVVVHVIRQIFSSNLFWKLNGLDLT